MHLQFETLTLTFWAFCLCNDYVLCMTTGYMRESGGAEEVKGILGA